MQVIGGRDDGIHVGDYDVILYSAVGLRPVAMLGADHPAEPLSTMSLSAGLLDTMIRKHPTLVAHLHNLKQIRAHGFDGQILCENWIRPAWLRPAVNDKAWTRFCDTERVIVDEELAIYGAKAVGHLPEQSYMTPGDYVLSRESGATHGNGIYAKRMVEKLLAAIDQA
jgi:hypothetical protein